MNLRVPDYGPHDAPLLVVGEAGGKNEGARGKPFVGAVGQRVRGIVRALGLDDQKDVRWANVIPMELPTLPKNPWAMQHVVRGWWSALDETLTAGKHKAVLAYGRAALWRLAGRTAITDEHGAVYEISVGTSRVPLVVSLHPAAVMHSKIEAGWTLVNAATERAVAYAKGLEYDHARQRPSFEWCYGAQRIVDLTTEALMMGRPVAVDTEYGKDHRAFLVGLSCDGEHVLSVVPNEDTIPALRTLLMDKRIVKLFHHQPADIKSLSLLGLTVRAPVVDTLLLYSTVFPDLPVGLEHCALHFFAHWARWKDMDHGDPQYNAIDVVATWRLFDKLWPMANGKLRQVWDTEARHVGLLCMAMEARGLAVDAQAQREAVTENEREAAAIKAQAAGIVDVIFAARRRPYEQRLPVVLKELEGIVQPRLKKDRDPAVDARVAALRKERDRCRILVERWGRGFDLGNNDHLRWLLYDEDGFKLPVQYREGRPTANADAIARLLALKRVQQDDAIRNTLVGVKEYQHLKKMTSTFLLWDVGADDLGQPSAAIDAQGTAHPEYRAFGTGTGRLAGGPDSDLGDRKINPYAYNAMNIPEETRRIYIPHTTAFNVDVERVDTEIHDDTDLDDGDGVAVQDLQSVL